MKSMNIVAVVQARMQSTRLPGKVLKEVVGRPVLWHIVQRLRAAKLVDRVVIAAPDGQADEPIHVFAEENGIDFYAGSEHDLLDRIYQAAKKYAADMVVWITADCPLVDPTVVDAVIQHYLDNQGRYDVVSAFGPLQEKRPYPDGLDAMVFPFRLLEGMWREVKDPFWREWFAPNFSRQPEKYRYGTMPVYRDLSHLRWTLDREDDLEFISQVYQRLYRKDRIFLMEDVLKLLEEQPELTEINKNQIPEAAYKQALETRKED